MNKLAIAFRAFCIVVLALAVLQIAGTKVARGEEGPAHEAEVQPSSNSGGSMALVEELKKKSKLTLRMKEAQYNPKLNDEWFSEKYLSQNSR